jgi:hypothetical protein
MKRKIINFSYILLIVFICSSISLASDFNLQGEIRSDLEIEMDSNNQIQKLEQLVELELSEYYNQSGLLKISMDISNKNDDPIRLKEALVKLYFSDADLIIGQQRIAWGKTDGINPTDNFNPIDYTKPFAEDNYLEVPAARFKYYYGDWIVDSVWKPEFMPNNYPKSGDQWYLPSYDLIYNSSKPETTLSNSEYGFRVSKWSPNIDTSLSYYKGWSKEPAVNLSTNSIRYYKIKAIGADFAKDFGSFVLRGESTYFITENSPEVKNNYIKYVLGADFNPTNKLYINTQLFGEKEKEEDSKGITMSITYDLTSFKEFEFNIIYNLNDNDYYLNPKFNYAVMDGVDFFVGARLFSGEEGTEFGNFTEKDCLFIGLKRAF